MKTDSAVQQLCEVLTEACREAMTKEGFPPSEALLDKFCQEIRYALTLK